MSSVFSGSSTTPQNIQKKNMTAVVWRVCRALLSKERSATDMTGVLPASSTTTYNTKHGLILWYDFLVDHLFKTIADIHMASALSRLFTNSPDTQNSVNRPTCLLR